MATTGHEPSASDSSITALLVQLGEGNREVEELLIPQIYGELRKLAGQYMRRERGNHTLDPTALVNEAYVRLVQQPQVQWQSRAHFFATSSRLMRNILVDHARAKKADKRGGIRHQVTLDEALLQSKERLIDVLVLDEALDRLAMFDVRHARIVELHFFAGLTFEEIAMILKIGERTVKRDWSMARDWLKIELSKKRSGKPS